MMNTTDAWYKIKNEDEIDSPALLVYPDRVKKNIELLKSMIDDVSRLRTHVKTHKTGELIKKQMDAGIQKFKCATIAEAEMLGVNGARDVLLAYPLYGPKIGRFVNLVKSFSNTRYAAIVDNYKAAEALSNKAGEAGLVIDIYIDLNIGMGRTGIQPGGQALDLYRKLSTLQGINIIGFHAYDGHVRDIDIEKRKLNGATNFEPVAVMKKQLEQEGYSAPKIIIGGSPSFPVYAEYADVECSPGTFIFWDKGYGDTLPEQGFLPAAVLLTRVVSLPEPNKVCVDLGYKAVASENPLEKRVHFLNAPNLQVVSQSEEHLVLAAEKENILKTGDVLYAIPWHICPTVALYDKLLVVENASVKGAWDVTARKRW